MPRAASAGDQSSEVRCSECSNVDFLDEWAGEVAKCQNCGRQQVVQLRDRSWYSTTPGGDGLRREDDHADETAREVLRQVSSETLPHVWTVNFRSGQAVHRFAGVMEGARMLAIVPRGTVVLRLVGSSPQNWQDCLSTAVAALKEFTGNAGTPPVIAAATDSPGQFRTTVEGMPTGSERLRCIGYGE